MKIMVIKLKYDTYITEINEIRIKYKNELKLSKIKYEKSINKAKNKYQIENEYNNKYSSIFNTISYKICR